MRWTTGFVIAGITSSAVIAITWDRRPRGPDKIAQFRRILTVTNLMCLAGNRPKEPHGMKARRGGMVAH